MPLGFFLAELQPMHSCLSLLLAQLVISSSLLAPSACSLGPWRPCQLPPSPQTLSTAPPPGLLCPAVLSWMTSAATPWTFATRSFSPQAPSPSPQSSSTRPVAAAPSCTPTGLYTCVRLAGCRCHHWIPRTGPPLGRGVLSTHTLRHLSPPRGRFRPFVGPNLCLLALPLARAPHQVSWWLTSGSGVWTCLRWPGRAGERPRALAASSTTPVAPVPLCCMTRKAPWPRPATPTDQFPHLPPQASQLPTLCGLSLYQKLSVHPTAQ